MKSIKVPPHIIYAHVTQGPIEGEVKLKKEVRFADQTETMNQSVQGNRSRSYIKPSTPITNRRCIRDNLDKEHLIEMYPECFDGMVGCFEDYTYHITLDPKVKPTILAPRRVPLELMRNKFKSELDETIIIIIIIIIFNIYGEGRGNNESS